MLLHGSSTNAQMFQNAESLQLCMLLGLLLHRFVYDQTQRSDLPTAAGQLLAVSLKGREGGRKRSLKIRENCLVSTVGCKLCVAQENGNQTSPPCTCGIRMSKSS